jgi:hypothetical protein
VAASFAVVVRKEGSPPFGLLQRARPHTFTTGDLRSLAKSWRLIFTSSIAYNAARFSCGFAGEHVA